MNWFLEEKIEPSEHKISFGDTVLFLGSCFSENIYLKGKESGLHFLNSQFGTIFHPIPLVRILNDVVDEIEESRILSNNDRFFSWDASSKWNGLSLEKFQSEMKDERLRLFATLKKAKFLFLTFGTSKEYRIGDDLIVANCHKMPSSSFRSDWTSISEMEESYTVMFSKLFAFNPNIQVVLTVSPVRHSKDGLTQNNRSKARLLLLCEELSKIEQVSYFPAYEMVMDELRDYRFYTADKVHPTEEAVQYVWSKFQETYFKEETKQLALEVQKKRQFFNHRHLNEPTDKERLLFLKKETELKNFLSQNPQINW